MKVLQKYTKEELVKAIESLKITNQILKKLTDTSNFTAVWEHHHTHTHERYTWYYGKIEEDAWRLAEESYDIYPEIKKELELLREEYKAFSKKPYLIVVVPPEDHQVSIFVTALYKEALDIYNECNKEDDITIYEGDREVRVVTELV
jgi:hypothetical protein